MTEKRWLTKDEKRLLKPHAEHYRAMYNHLGNASMERHYGGHEQKQRSQWI